MTGLAYKLLPKRSVVSVYVSLIISMLCGRVVWGAVSYVLYGIRGNAFTWQMFTAGAFINAIPGIIIQIVIIPVIIIALERAKLINNGQSVYKSI